jgi:diaminohydroxyphosphoribosylaminopyrimidine deaminase/5-amino-6-(5-phosphoribosylamino)uracil reductase
VVTPEAGDTGSADREMMRIALAHAARGQGRTSPNPIVGSVIVSAGGVRVGAGHHDRAGESHAEIVALRCAGSRAAGATLYSTLEPCCHRGRTGPCVVSIVEAGIRRVVSAVADPNPLVAGRGFAYLREHGVEVTVGVMAEEAASLNAAFLTAVTAGRPHVTLKMATSLDGKVAARPGVRTVLTGPRASRHAHLMRAGLDAIGVGSTTVLVDDPLLTVRGVYRARPFLRVIFDRRLRVAPDAKVFGTLDQGPVLVCTTAAHAAAHPDRVGALQAAGAQVWAAGSSEIGEVLRELGRRDVRSLLLEGGPALHRAAWRAGVVDRVAAFVTPHRLGEDAVPWDLPADFSLACLARRRVVPLGPDVLIEGDVHGTR